MYKQCLHVKKIFKKVFKFNQIICFDGPLPKLGPAVVLSNQDGCRSAVALLLKAALIQVSYYRLLGDSG
jgi:hypothetical protein